MTVKPILLACLVALAPAAARAQYQMLSPMLYYGPVKSYEDHANAQNAGRTSAAPAAAASLSYRPDLTRRRANLAQFVAKSRATDPASAASLEALFARGDIIEMTGQALSQYGLRVDNLADAYAVWWITAWQATRGRNDDVSPATVKAVRAQAAQTLGGKAILAGAGDPVKQELAESLLIQTLLIDAAVDQAKTDAAQMKKVGAAVNQGAQGMGLDLMRLNLTETGFSPL